MLKKEITFIYTDLSEKEIMIPLSEEAKKRGYIINLTTNRHEKCEIGIYCQHVNFPQYSKFSVIMLHDIIQQYGNWPDIWMNEPWNKYDIGILPSNQWVENWVKSSSSYYTRPKKGVYKIGWPKADNVLNVDCVEYKKEFYKKYNLDPDKKTILYAPAWENDHKEEDFVQSMLKLDVNILIKQCKVNPELFPQIVENINEMYELHKDIPQVTLLDPKTNIFDAILAADVLVSEESSTMCEAIMMGIPAVSVSDWLVPDVTPSRYPACNYEFVIMTKKEDLTDCVGEIVSNYAVYKKQACDYRDKTFCNMGKASSMIMDIIDDAVAEKRIRYEEIKPLQLKRLSLKKYLKHKYISLKREVYGNYREKSRAVSFLWKIMHKIKEQIVRK